jgi:hypothetical protein
MRTLTIATSAILFVTAVRARADTPTPPFSYTVSKGAFLFVMLAPEESDNWSDERKAQLKQIRETYPSSGVYRNDGSRNPLWTVDWYAPQVYLSSDGVYVVREHGAGLVSGRMNTSGPNREETQRFLEQTAFSFYANSHLVGECGTRDLVDDVSGLDHSVTTIRWLESARLSDAAKQLTVRTKDGNTIVLDIRNGKVVQKQTDRPVVRKRWALRIGPIILALGILGIIWWAARRRGYALLFGR